MRLSLVLVFLTLVGSIGTAAPSPTPDVRDSQEKSENRERRDPRDSETLRWSEPPDNGKDLNSLGDPSRPTLRGEWDWWVMAGVTSGSILEKDEPVTQGTIGVMASWNPDFHRAWDFQADFGFSDWIRVSAARRFPFRVDRSYAPFWKWGFSQTIEAERMAASLVDLERLKVFASIGLMDVFELDERWRVEAGVSGGLLGPALLLQTGWRW